MMRLSAFALAAVLAIPAAVQATFTIAATDASTNQVGASGSSCVSMSLYDAAYHGVPNHGVFMTQASPPELESPVYERGTSLIEAGELTSAEIIDAVANPEIDPGDYPVLVFFEDGTNLTTSFPNFEMRQYGVVTLDGEPDGYSGASIQDFYVVEGWKEPLVQNHTQKHRGGMVDEYRYQAQGNIVTDTTVPTLITGFQGDVECDDLAGRLFAALEAVFEAPEFTGDVRCPGLWNHTHSGSSAFLHVDNPDGSELLHLERNIVLWNLTNENPFDSIKEEYLAWRADNPCAGAATSETTTPEAPEGSQTDPPAATDAPGDSTAATEAPGASSSGYAISTFGSNLMFWLGYMVLAA